MAGSRTDTFPSQAAGEGAQQGTGGELRDGQRYGISLQKACGGHQETTAVQNVSCACLSSVELELLLKQVILINALVTVKELLLKCSLRTAIGRYEK